MKYAIAALLALGVFAGCGNENNGTYDEGFDDGFRRGQMSEFEVASNAAEEYLSRAITSGWFCESSLYESLGSLWINCEEVN